MNLGGVEIVCPACRAELEPVRDDLLACVGCACTFPVVLGIPDLRLWPDPYIGFEEDRAKARMLAESCAGLGFAAAVEFYYRVTDAVPEFQARRFARSLHAAAGRSDALLRDVNARDTHDTRDTRDTAAIRGTAAVRDISAAADSALPPSLLDLGCGTAPLLASAATRYDHVAGVDIALRWLVLARKRLDEMGVQAPLLCACAEALPFPDAAFDHIIGESTVEHLRDQGAAMLECHRALRAGGRLFITTPNRHSVGPDPHTGLPAGGWLPEAVTAAYVRRKGGIPPRRQLLTARTLRALLERAGFTGLVIEPPHVADAQLAMFGRVTRLALGAYHVVKAAPGGAALLRAVGPLLHASARKPAGGAAASADSISVPETAAT